MTNEVKKKISESHGFHGVEELTEWCIKGNHELQ